MKEDSLFFVKVKEICKPLVHTCPPDEPVRNVARLMKEKNVSGIIVTENQIPLGIITDRDFRNKIVAANTAYSDMTAISIMSSPLITIRETDYLFEAIYLATKHNIHRLAVTDEMGRLTGVITDTDIIKHHTKTPLYFIRDLEYATTLDDLKKLDKKVIDLARYLLSTGVKTREVVRFIAHLNDSVALKVIDLITKDSYIPLPHDFAFLVLGSEGRMEQTLKTDQDNAMLYGDSLSAEDMAVLDDFSVRLIDSLIAIGVPVCPGGTMAKNKPWRRTYTEWLEVLTKWISVPVPDNILNYSMFSDLRTIYGNCALEKALKEEIRRLAAENPLFLAYMAKNTLRFPPPVGFFGNLKVEKTGEHRGKLDIKKAGIFPVSEGVKVLALDTGIMNGGTVDKIHKLIELNIMSHDDLLELETSYNFFVYVRLKNNLNEIARGEKPSNFVRPEELNHIEQERLKIGFSVIKSFQNFLKDRYRLDFIR